jgi:hypothetical protein
VIRRDILAGVDDFAAELALARRARQRHLANAPSSLCGRLFTHPRQPTQLDARGFLVVDTCECVLLSRHNIERRVYRVDANGREHYATRPLGGS